MNIIGGIWLMTTVLTFYLFISVFLTAREKFKTKHPTAKIEKSLFGEKIYGYVMVFVIISMPIFHLLALFILATQYDDIVKETIFKLENKIISEE